MGWYWVSMEHHCLVLGGTESQLEVVVRSNGLAHLVGIQRQVEVVEQAGSVFLHALKTRESLVEIVFAADLIIRYILVNSPSPFPPVLELYHTNLLSSTNLLVEFFVF